MNDNVVPFLGLKTCKIATLTVSPDTLTPSLVVQLREEPLFGHDGRLNGDVWGVWDSYLIWQRGGQLRKTLILDAFSPLLRLDDLKH